MSEKNILIIGQGSIGLAVSNELAIQNYDVTGLARGERCEYELHNKADFIQADALTLTANKLQPFTDVAVIVTPNNYGVEDYKNTYFGIAKHLADLSSQLRDLKRVVFISSTGVYGQSDGEWIDENTQPTTPKRETSTYILKAEQVLQKAFGSRTVIIRPSGIYGKNRLMRVRKAQEDNKPALSTSAWTNRIMDSDLVTIILNVLTMSDANQLKPVYLATDYMPVTSYELTCWLATQLNSSLPMPEKLDGADELGDKKISGKRLHSNIPRQWLKYPDWQSGYEYILQSLKT